MKRLNSQKGFTLIELVVVIVILGILAATAAPKFIDLQDDAQDAVLVGVKGAMNSASALAHSKSLIDGTNEAATTTITVNGTNIDLVYGYPAATAAGIGALLDIDSSDSGTDTEFTFNAGTGVFTIYPQGKEPASGQATTDACSVTYTQATAVAGPPLVITASDADTVDC